MNPRNAMSAVSMKLIDNPAGEKRITNNAQIVFHCKPAILKTDAENKLGGNPR